MVFILGVYVSLWIVYCVFFTPQSDISEPLAAVNHLPFLLVSFLDSPLFLITVISIILYFIHVPLLYILLGRFLHKCPYCETLRDDSPPFLVNGYCSNSNCNKYLCRKCFYYENKEEGRSPGCPSCNGSTFIPDKMIAYKRLPKIIRNRMIK